MTVRLHILAACGLAILASLAIASAVAAHSRLPGGGAGRSASAGPGFASGSPAAATATPTAAAATPTASPTSEPETSATPAAYQHDLPVPKEAQPSTDAQPIAGPGSLLQRQPTPKPHRPTVILDPGHGRGDPGAVHHTADGTVDLTEAEANLSIAREPATFPGGEGIRCLRDAGRLRQTAELGAARAGHDHRRPL